MTILCYGEIDLDIYLKLDCLPTMERSADCQDEFENVGGAAANSALWLANWGLPTRLAGHDLGDDRAGHAVHQELNAHPNLDARFVARHTGYRTPRCSCLVTPDGERSFIVHWPERIRMTAPSPEMLQDIRWLNLDKSGPLSLRLQTARMAADRDIPILINDIYEVDNPILPLVDVLVLSADIIRNRHERAEPTPLALELQAVGNCDVIITDAGGDIRVVSRNGDRATVTPPAIQPLDTTGAGDIFKSGLLYGLLQGLPVSQAARWGAAAGSLMCQYAGTTETLAPLSAVMALHAEIN